MYSDSVQNPEGRKSHRKNRRHTCIRKNEVEVAPRLDVVAVHTLGHRLTPEVPARGPRPPACSPPARSPRPTVYGAQPPACSPRRYARRCPAPPYSSLRRSPAAARAPTAPRPLTSLKLLRNAAAADQNNTESDTSELLSDVPTTLKRSGNGPKTFALV
jgi:hypothetical protein